MLPDLLLSNASTFWLSSILPTPFHILSKIDYSHLHRSHKTKEDHLPIYQYKASSQLFASLLVIRSRTRPQTWTRTWTRERQPNLPVSQVQFIRK